MLRSTLILALLVALLLPNGVGAATYKVTAKADGQPVSAIKSQPDGREVHLYKSTTTTVRSQASHEGLVPAGKWNRDTYLLSVSTGPGKADEVFWQHETSYLASQAKITPEDARVLDVLLGGGSNLVLFVSGSTVIFERWTRADGGTWGRAWLGVVPIPEIDRIGRSVTKGQIMDGMLVQLDYKNGDMEKWSFPTSGEAQLVGHNDLKCNFKSADSLHETK